MSYTRLLDKDYWLIHRTAYQVIMVGVLVSVACRLTGEFFEHFGVPEHINRLQIVYCLSRLRYAESSARATIFVEWIAQLLLQIN